jgi:hypothetical protein
MPSFLLPHYCTPHTLSCSGTAMEPTSLQRSDRKRMDKLRRIRGCLDHKESPLMESKKAIVLACAKALEMSGEAHLKPISSHLQLLKDKMDLLLGSPGIRNDRRGAQRCALAAKEYLNAGACSLEKAVTRRTKLEVIKSGKELWYLSISRNSRRA